jgi:hypothetical protein
VTFTPALVQFCWQVALQGCSPWALLEDPPRWSPSTLLTHCATLLYAFMLPHVLSNMLPPWHPLLVPGSLHTAPLPLQSAVGSASGAAGCITVRIPKASTGGCVLHLRYAQAALPATDAAPVRAHYGLHALVSPYSCTSVTTVNRACRRFVRLAAGPSLPGTSART